MEQDLLEAKNYLSQQGYGRGTNYSTNLVVILLANYAQEKVKKLQQHVVMQGLLSDCCQAPVTTTEIHYCKECECSCSPTVGQRSGDTGVSDGHKHNFKYTESSVRFKCSCGKYEDEYLSEASAAARD